MRDAPSRARLVHDAENPRTSCGERSFLQRGIDERVDHVRAAARQPPFNGGTHLRDARDLFPGYPEASGEPDDVDRGAVEVHPDEAVIAS